VTESSVKPAGRKPGDLHRGLRGFYSVLDRNDDALAEALVSPAGAGSTVLQVRLKPAPTRELLAAAHMARAVTRRHGALLVVNDRLDVALAVGADAVHLGQDDLPLAAARAIGGDRLWIGISTHNEDQVAAAVAGGADYLGFGPVYATATKIDPDPVQGIEGLRRAVSLAGAVPVVAIGGITPERAAEVAATGAAAACAIGSVNLAPRPGDPGRAIADAWRPRS